MDLLGGSEMTLETDPSMRKQVVMLAMNIQGNVHPF